MIRQATIEDSEEEIDIKKAKLPLKQIQKFKERNKRSNPKLHVSVGSFN